MWFTNKQPDKKQVVFLVLQKKKNINSVKWSLFKGVDLILEAQCQDDNLKKKKLKTTRKTTTNDENYVNFSIDILLVR